MWLANRYYQLEGEFRKEGRSSPGKQALNALQDEFHPDRKGALSTIKRLVRIGQQESNFFDELHAKRHNKEPLSDLEQEILRQSRLRWLRWLRRRRRKV
jgi:hypothetical protein